mmetsp:Transcript_50519/g.134356  ORF Transcript_50519/g.134356 Transcript_50519/m.134356 type:complete len:206 (-) Transcript_50519:134-751(-)
MSEPHEGIAPSRGHRHPWVAVLRGESVTSPGSPQIPSQFAPRRQAPRHDRKASAHVRGPTSVRRSHAPACIAVTDHYLSSSLALQVTVPALARVASSFLRKWLHCAIHGVTWAVRLGRSTSRPDVPARWNTARSKDSVVASKLSTWNILVSCASLCTSPLDRKALSAEPQRQYSQTLVAVKKSTHTPRNPAVFVVHSNGPRWCPK